MRTYGLASPTPCSLRCEQDPQPSQQRKRAAVIAIFHASTKPLARKAGRSAVAAAAYRAGVELVDERTGVVHDYTRRGGVVTAELILPNDVTADRATLWNAAEAAERRKDARTAREWIIGLPSELNDQQRATLARRFAVEIAKRYGVAVDLAIHAPDRGGDQRNHHAHLLTTTRDVSCGVGGELILGSKTAIELGDKDRLKAGIVGKSADDIVDLRATWAEFSNSALEIGGQGARIDHRSLAAQRVDREPTIHMGWVAMEMERRGAPSNRGDENRKIVENNQERTRLQALIFDLREIRQRGEAVVKRFLALAIKRAQRVVGYRDGQRLWMLTPAPLKGLIEKFNSATAPEKQAVVRVMHQPSKAAPIGQLLDQRDEAIRERSASLQRPGQAKGQER